MRNSPGRGDRVEGENGTPPASPGIPFRDSDAPLAGVSSAIITSATRRVARRWSDEATAAGAPPSGRDHDVVASISVFKTRTDAEASSKLAEDWVHTNLPAMTKPRKLAGELVAH